MKRAVLRINRIRKPTNDPIEKNARTMFRLLNESRSRIDARWRQKRNRLLKKIWATIPERAMKLARGDGDAQARPIIERLIWLATELRSGKKVNAKILADEFEIHQKTAQRDLDFLRDRMRYSLEFHKAQNSYRLIHAPGPQL